MQREQWLKGEQGVAGDQGPAGTQGETGSEGPQGEEGSAGTRGASGYPGLMGPAADGATGAKDDTGDVIDRSIFQNNTATTLDSTGDVGFHTSVATGSDGLELISYYDDTNADLKVAHCSNQFCPPYFRRR